MAWWLGEYLWAPTNIYNGLQRHVKCTNILPVQGPTDKAKEPDPGGSDQHNLGYKKLKNGTAWLLQGMREIKGLFEATTILHDEVHASV